MKKIQNNPNYLQINITIKSSDSQKNYFGERENNQYSNDPKNIEVWWPKIDLLFTLKNTVNYSKF